MKYLNKFNTINENWKYSLIEKLDYKREDDIRDCFTGLLDIGLSEVHFAKTICDSDFKESDIFIDNSKSLYPEYMFELNSDDVGFSQDYIIELMENIIDFLERLKSNGYEYNIDELKISSFERIDKKIDIEYIFSVYHPNDKIPLAMISASKNA